MQQKRLELEKDFTLIEGMYNAEKCQPSSKKAD